MDRNSRLYLLVQFNGLRDPKSMKEDILQRFRRWQMRRTTSQAFGLPMDRSSNSGFHSRILE